jgi:hypothetical protein
MEKKEELSMKKKFAIMVVAVFLALGMYTPACFGYSVAVGDWITYGNSYGNLTGEMAVSVGSSSSGPFNYVYNTFCLEVSENMNWNTPYYVNDISDSAIRGGTDGDGGATPGRDPLSIGTAYLYYNFYAGTLANYNYVDPTNRTTSADALQIAIWYLENEIDSFSTGWHYYGNNWYNVSTTVHNLVDTFLADAASSGWNDIGTVRAVNIVSYDYFGHCTNKQSSLIAEVVVTPEPLTVSLLGLGILALGVMRRRMRK